MRTDPALLPRVLTAVVAVPLLAWCIRAGGVWYQGYASALAVLALLEFLSLGGAPVPPMRLAACLLGLSVTLAAAWLGLPSWSLILVLSMLLVLLAEVLAGPTAGLLERAGGASLALAYAGGLGACLLLLRGGSASPGLPGGMSGVLAAGLAHGLAWSADTGAYTVGLLVGRHPMHSRISPGKTWEGALGGAVSACLLGSLAAHFWMPSVPLWLAAVFGLVGGIVAQLGDLTESALKRACGAKDSGSWIPGHGGVLDRFDSVLFTAPYIYFCAQLIQGGQP